MWSPTGRRRSSAACTRTAGGGEHGECDEPDGRGGRVRTAGSARPRGCRRRVHAVTVVNRRRHPEICRASGPAGRIRTSLADDSRAAQSKTPLAIVEVAASARAVKTGAADLADRGILRGRQPGELGEVTREPQRGVVPPPRGARAPGRSAPDGPPASAASSAASARLGSGLQVRRIAVPPPAVQPPDAADDELRLVVDRLQVRAIARGPRGAAPCAGCRRAAPPRSSLRSSGRRGSPGTARCPSAPKRTRSAPMTGSPWPGRRISARRAGHPPQRRGPLCGIALDLLGVAGVRAGPDEQVAAGHRTFEDGIHVTVWSSVSPFSWRRWKAWPPTSRSSVEA